MNRFILSTLMVTAIALPTAAKAEMSPEQKKEVEALIKDYILNHGDVVVESVNKLQMKQEEENNKKSEGQAKDLIAKLKTDKNLAFAGNPDGNILMVEFFDYNCGYCKKAFTEIQSVLKDDKDVKVIFIDLPILSPQSHESAKWSLAAKKQGKYFEMHKALMAHNGELTEADYKKLATDAGLDADKLAKDKASPDIEEEVKNHLKLAQDLNIQGTPGFLINEKVFRGYIPYDVIQKTIQEARDTAKK